jgi:hypothetical protein
MTEQESPIMTTQYTITRITPDGITKTATRDRLRDAGHHVFQVLRDNCGADRKTATDAGVQLEKTGRVEALGYTFTLSTNS